jgi:hypothetical protein
MKKNLNLAALLASFPCAAKKSFAAAIAEVMTMTAGVKHQDRLTITRIVYRLLC